MAAGLGSRLLPFTENCAKPFLPVMGIPTLQFAIETLRQAAVTEVIVNLHYRYRDSLKLLKSLNWGNIKLIVSDESELLMGSAGGLRRAIEHFKGEPFYILNGDNLLEIDLKKLAAMHATLSVQHGVSLTLALLKSGSDSGIQEAYREIDFNPTSHLLEGVGDLRSSVLFYCGAAVVQPEILKSVSNEIPSEFLPEILLPAIKQKTAAGFQIAGQWIDTGTPALWWKSHLKLMGLWEKNLLPPLWKSQIENRNKRVGPCLWVFNGISNEISNRIADGIEQGGRCRPPLYLQSDNSVPPTLGRLGPNAVVYGNLSEDRSNGLAYGKHWAGELSEVARP